MLRNIRIWQKLVLICVLLTVPLALITMRYVGKSAEEMNFTVNELEGNKYLFPVAGIMGKTLEMRSIASRMRMDPTLAEKIPPISRDIDVALGKVADLEQKEGYSGDILGKQFSSERDFANVRATWADLKNNLPPQKQVFETEPYERFLDALNKLYETVGDKSNLILDPDLDSYYVMDFTTIRYPKATRTLSDVILSAEGILNRRVITPEEKAEVMADISALSDHADAISAGLDKAIRENSNVKKTHTNSVDKLRSIESQVKEFTQSQRAFFEAVEKRIIHAPRIELLAAEFAPLAQNALNGYGNLYKFAVPALDQIMDLRVASIRANRNYGLGIVAIFFLAAVVAVSSIIRRITQQLRTAVIVTTRLSQGDLTAQADIRTQDEIGMVLAGVNGVVNYLREMGSVAEAIAAGNLTARVQPRSQADNFGNAFKIMIENLREIVGTLQRSAQLLTESVGNLNASASEQSQTITRQAAALQETQVTAQEIKQTSLLAAQKAEDVLKMAERADEVSRQGETAIEQSLAGLGEIRSQVDEIALKIAELNERTRQIGSITDTVKDLADQSNMLALNAAIEAVRSGEHGKGFAVVAREIRNLADQSIQATSRVREILEDIGGAIRRAVTITERGSQKMEGGLAQVKTSGENLRELSNIVKDNSAAGRQIAAAVSQQNAGITQIFSALTDQTQMMDETVKRLNATTQATTVVRDVTQRVSDVVKRYRV